MRQNATERIYLKSIEKHNLLHCLYWIWDCVCLCVSVCVCPDSSDHSGASIEVVFFQSQQWYWSWNPFLCSAASGRSSTSIQLMSPQEQRRSFYAKQLIQLQRFHQTGGRRKLVHFTDSLKDLWRELPIPAGNVVRVREHPGTTYTYIPTYNFLGEAVV